MEPTIEPGKELNDTFLTSRQLRQRYGNVSQQWLWRREKENSGFPRALRIQNRKYWRLSELIAYEKELVK
jgi:hypothetical protein